MGRKVEAGKEGAGNSTIYSFHEVNSTIKIIVFFFREKDY